MPILLVPLFEVTISRPKDFSEGANSLSCLTKAFGAFGQPFCRVLIYRVFACSNSVLNKAVGVPSQFFAGACSR
jgi:hypothetical protein